MNISWPALSYQTGKDTYTTLHLFTQIAGKIKLACLPWANHSWNVTLHITPQGLSTQNMPYAGKNFQIDFDLIHHHLKISTSLGEIKEFSLQNLSVSQYYTLIFQQLSALDIELSIMTNPSEIYDAIPFEKDATHATYEPAQAVALHLALLRIQDVFMQFRCGFSGKSSPIHFFWGGFDLSLAFFSGEKAPPHPGKMPGMPDWVLQDAFSHEVSDSGFIAGNELLTEPAFYCYLYPEPEGYSTASIQPAEAYYHKELGEFILPYAAVQQAADPSGKLLEFLKSTYQLAATLGKWNPDFVAPVPGH